MRARLAFALLCGFFAAASARGEDTFDKLRQEIRAVLERESLPSLAVAVVRDGKILWEEGFGWANKEQQVRATENTPYSIASISKPVTATALMVLVQRGQLELDRPANMYLGDSPLTAHVGDVRDATLRRLANHTAGLPLHYQFYYSDENYPLPGRAESIRRYGHLLEAPGVEYQYANFGFGVLDEIIARRAQVPFAEFLGQQVFQPLAMKHSAIGIPPGLEAMAAIRYTNDGSPLPFYEFDHPGASAVYSSAHDLALFASFHLLQPMTEQQSILSSQSIREMQRPTADFGSGQHYGVGWFVADNEYGYRTVSHTGGMGGVRCRLVLVPEEKVAVVTLCNANHDLPLRMSRRILGELLPEYGAALRKATEHKPDSEPGRPFAPAELVGYWRGHVSTFAGDRPTQAWVQPDGDVKLQISDGLLTLLNQSQLQNGLLTGVLTGDLATPDANRRPYRLQLRARLEPDRLRGALTAVSLPGTRAGNALSHWIDLQRVDVNPDSRSLSNGVNLDGWRVAEEVDFEDHGPVHVDGGEIVLGRGKPGTGIVFAGKPPRMNYELTLEARRIAGNDFFCGLTFPVADSYLSLILGGWGGGVTGLSNLDGASAVENETTGHHDFEPGRWYQIRLRVTPGKVQVWLDGKSIVDTAVEGRKLSIWWEQEPMRPLGIASWDTTAAVRNIWFKRL